jgi:hypothetical protein
MEGGPASPTVMGSTRRRPLAMARSGTLRRDRRMRNMGIVIGDVARHRRGAIVRFRQQDGTSLSPVMGPSGIHQRRRR